MENLEFNATKATICWRMQRQANQMKVRKKRVHIINIDKCEATMTRTKSRKGDKMAISLINSLILFVFIYAHETN